ncbi:MAG: Sulphatase-modifying factor protein [Ramlibacter sp.]|nr:Sulphatase-modifying factor protein [Ramlibacter sp.]
MTACVSDVIGNEVLAAGGMRWIPGGTFLMGSEAFYPEEAPVRRVHVDGFWIDEVPVTNAMFAAFVAATKHRTLAETPLHPRDYPHADAATLRAGSLLFVPPAEPVSLANPAHWWTWCVGADWRHPYGPQSTLAGLEDHPVVHVAWQDAAAYAEWAGKSLPTEAEWELAARGGLEARDYAWGDELEPEGRLLANYWHGEFPWRNSLADGFLRTSPVRTFPPNGFGLHDVIGNVWEWTSDWYLPASALAGNGPACGCAARNPRGGSQDASREPLDPSSRLGRRVLKGGSHLCSPDHCRRYRPAARYPQPIDTTTSHVGFRCVRRGGEHTTSKD